MASRAAGHWLATPSWLPKVIVRVETDILSGERNVAMTSKITNVHALFIYNNSVHRNVYKYIYTGMKGLGD